MARQIAEINSFCTALGPKANKGAEHFFFAPRCQPPGMLLPAPATSHSKGFSKKRAAIL